MLRLTVDVLPQLIQLFGQVPAGKEAVEHALPIRRTARAGIDCHLESQQVAVFLRAEDVRRANRVRPHVRKPTPADRQLGFLEAASSRRSFSLRARDMNHSRAPP